MKHVEKFIRHLQSSIEKRKVAIYRESDVLCSYKECATYFYDVEDSKRYKKYASYIKDSKGVLKSLHKQQKTETEMLKWLENIRSSYEEMSCAIYGE